MKFIVKDMSIDDNQYIGPSGTSYLFRNIKYKEATEVNDERDIEYFKNKKNFEVFTIGKQVKKKVEEVKEKITKPKKIFTSKELKALNRPAQTDILRKMGYSKTIPHYEDDIIKLILKLQKG